VVPDLAVPDSALSHSAMSSAAVSGQMSVSKTPPAVLAMKNLIVSVKLPRHAGDEELCL
jgi:hypothetical protein